MKVGIITVHDSMNFGSILQAFGLKTILEDMGHDVSFIKTRSREDLKKVFTGGAKGIRRNIFNRKKYKLFLKDINAFKEIDLDDVKTNPDSLDAIVIGSDELWNVNQPIFRNEYFYGIDINVKKKITYAISNGGATYEKLMEYPNLIEGIKKLDKIFIRDELTMENVTKITGEIPEFTCDPTFLVDISSFKKEYINPIKSKYILIYAYFYSNKQREYICKYAKENNYKIVSVGLYCSFADKNINCSAFEFSEMICGAEAVITATFHGTIFSILNKKKFITFTGKEKAKDVLKKTGLLNAMFDENQGYEKFKEQFNDNLDIKGAYDKILEMRKKGKEKLKLALEE